MTEETIENDLHNTFQTAKFVEKRDDGWLFDLDGEEKALVPTDDFTDEPTFAAGEEVELLVERPYGGQWAASVSKVAKLKLWDEYEELAQTGGIVEGIIVGSNKGGMSVDIGLRAFMPLSQIDVHRVEDVSGYIGVRSKFKVTEFDKKRGNIVVSRRACLERNRNADRGALLEKLAPGQEYDGTVRNVKEFGAFIDIGGLEGLLHTSNMSWGRVDHPSELFRPGDAVRVLVLDWNPEKRRLGLGRKQLLSNPWDALAERYNEGDILEGKVVSLADFGAFVEVEPGLDGLVHVTELSWTDRVEHPRDVLNVGEVVKVVVNSIDLESRRLGLSIKKLEKNPWEIVANEVKQGDVIEGEVKNVVDFGLFVELRPGVEALVHVSDLSWTEKIADPREHYQVGQTVEAKVLDIDVEAGRASLGIKQLSADPWENATNLAKVGDRVEVTITRLTDFGAFAEIADGIEGLIHISELADKRIERPAEVVKPGQKHMALVMSFDRANERISLSLKREELENDKVKGYSDEGSATALGDVLRNRLGLEDDEA